MLLSTVGVGESLICIKHELLTNLLLDGIRYPKDTTFMFNIDGIHKSEKYFPNPKEYDPNRFMPENAHRLRKNSFIPFSVGPRDCIGKRLWYHITMYVHKSSSFLAVKSLLLYYQSQKLNYTIRSCARTFTHCYIAPVFINHIIQLFCLVHMSAQQLRHMNFIN